jgi:hypothetical protein
MLIIEDMNKGIWAGAWRKIGSRRNLSKRASDILKDIKILFGLLVEQMRVKLSIVGK